MGSYERRVWRRVVRLMFFAVYLVMYPAAIAGDIAALACSHFAVKERTRVRSAKYVAIAVGCSLAYLWLREIYRALCDIQGPFDELKSIDFNVEVTLSLKCGLLLVLRACTLFALGVFICCYVVCAAFLNLWIRAPVTVSLTWLGAACTFLYQP